MKLFRNLTVIVALSLSLGLVAKADPFNTISKTYQLTTSDRTQLGRLSRNSDPQTYAMNEVYPGVVNTTTNYYYQSFAYDASLFAGAPYIDISTYDPTNGASYFISAYKGSYDPTNLATNWLGDAGFSGNYQTNDGGAFSITLPVGSNLVVVLNSTLANAAPTYPFTFNIQGFSDTSFGDPLPQAVVTPEPSSLILASTGLLGLAGAVRRRLRSAELGA